MDYQKPNYEDGVADWGFTNPDPGWYLMEIMDNSEEKVKDDGKTVLRMPLKAVEEGFQQSFFITIAGHVSDKEAGFAKKKIADIITVTGMWDLFDKNFPGQISLLDPRVISAIRTKLSGRTMMVNLEETTKDKKTFINIRKLAPANFVPPVEVEDKKAKPKAAAKPKGGDPAPGPVPGPEAWE
jgi:hypothetical protein